MENILVFITGGSIVASVLIGFLKNWIKSFIEPRWGALGIQATLLVIAFLLALGVSLWQNYVTAEVGKLIIGIFLGATALYEVIWKAIYQKAIKGTTK